MHTLSDIIKLDDMKLFKYRVDRAYIKIKPLVLGIDDVLRSNNVLTPIRHNHVGTALTAPERHSAKHPTDGACCVDIKMRLDKLHEQSIRNPSRA